MQKTHTVGILTDDLGSQHQNEALSRCQNERIQQNNIYCVGANERECWWMCLRAAPRPIK